MDLAQQSRNRSIVLVIGNSGSGKTTVAKFLCGYPLESYLADDGLSFLIKDTQNKMSFHNQSTTIFKSTVPEMYTDNTTGTIFYDLPGFKDTRSPELSVAHGVFMKMVADHAARLKIMIVVPHRILRGLTERNASKTLFQHSTDFIRNIEKFKPSISLMVTNVEDRASDDRIIASIRHKLLTYKSQLPGSFQNHTYNLHGFLDLIDALTDLSSSGTPTKIALFRTPSEEGLLSDFPEMAECKERGLQMIHERLQWIDNDEKSEFGYTVSEDSISFIIMLSNSFNNFFSKVTQNLAEQIVEDFEPELRNILENLEAFDNETFEQIDNVKDKMGQFAELISQLRSGMDLSPSNIVLRVADFLQTRFSRVSIISNGNISDLSQQSFYMQTLKSISSDLVTFETERWLTPLDSTSTLIGTRIAQTIFNTSRHVSEMFNAEFLNATQSIAINVGDHFTTALEDVVRDLSAYRNGTYVNILRMKTDSNEFINLVAKLNSMEATSSDFALKLKNLLQARFPSIWNSLEPTLSILLERANFMQVLKNFSSEWVVFQNERWIQPLERISREIKYKMNNNLTNTVSKMYEILELDLNTLVENICKDWQVEVDWELTTSTDVLKSEDLGRCAEAGTKNVTCDVLYQNKEAVVGIHKSLLQELLRKSLAANNANDFLQELQRTLVALESGKKYLSNFVSKSLIAVHELKWKIFVVEEAKETNGTSITSPITTPLLKLQRFLDLKLEIILPLEARIEVKKLQNKIVQLITNIGFNITKSFHENLENLSSPTDFDVFQRDLSKSEEATLNLTSAQNCTSLALKIKALQSSSTVKRFNNPYLIEILEDIINMERRYKIDCDVSRLSSLFKPLVNSIKNLIEKLTYCFFGNEDFSGSIMIQSNYVQMSTAMKCIEMRQHQLTSIVLEATHAVIFDRNFSGTEISTKHPVNLVILSPLWISAGNAVIDLSGSPGEAYPKAFGQKANFKPDRTGKDGQPGLPGVSGGNFIGRGIHFRGGKLSILSIGGNGGDGQDGKMGKHGICTEELHPRALDTVQRHLDKQPKGFCFLSAYDCYRNYHHQLRGTNGKNGGNGGIGGIGGFHGYVDILSLPDVRVVTGGGRNGRSGIGGRGGFAGNSGGGRISVLVRYVKDMFTCIISPVKWKDPNFQRGSDGINGGNSEGRKRPEQIPMASTLKYELHYKNFLIQQLTSNPSPFFPFTLPLLKSMNSQPTDNNYFIAIWANFQEFQYLEEQFYLRKHSQDLQQLYALLFTRSSALQAKLEELGSDSESQRAINLLVAVIFDRLTLLQQSSLLTNLEVDFEKFHRHATQNATFLRSIQQQIIQSKVIAIAQDRNTSQIQTKMYEAEQIIDNELQPEILKLEGDIIEQIDSILQTIEDLNKDKINNKKQLEEQQKRLNKLGSLRHVSSGLKVVGSVASFLGPKGAVVGALANGISNITDSVLRVESVNTSVSQLPDMILQRSNSFFQNLQDHKVSKKEKLLQELNDVKTEIDLIPELQPLKNKIEAAQAQLESPSNEGDSVNGVINNMTETLQNEINLILESSESNDNAQPNTTTEPVENASLKPNATKSKQILKSLDKCLKIVKLGSELYNKYKDDENKLEELSSAIQRSSHNIQAIEIKVASIVHELLPTISTIASDLQKHRNDFGKQGTSALLLSKWKIQNVLSDLKFNIRKSFTEGLQQEEYISRAVDKIELGFTTMISIYNDLQTYHRQSDLTKFVADVNANTDVEFTNAKLQGMYLDLKRIMLSNAIVQDHEDLMRTFKLWVFPFAHLFLKPEGLVAAKPTNDQIVVEMAESAKLEIQSLADKLESYRTKTYKGMDNSIIINSFIKTNASAPFYTWTSRRFARDLLSGNITTAVIDILKHPHGNLATKFNEIWISIQCSQFTTNNCSQEHLNHFLDKFGVKMRHSGNNKFGYKDKYYTMTSIPQEIFFSFEKGQDGNFTQRSIIYDKLAANAAILSPFTRWQFQIAPLRGAAVNETDWEVLQSYRDLVEVHLEGKGTYVEISHDTNGDIANNLDKYYTPDTSLYLKSLLLQD